MDSEDDLCELLDYTSMNYDERKELYEHLTNKIVNMDTIHDTDDRYNRYLRGIDVWHDKKNNYEFIKNDMISYLQIPSTEENFMIKYRLMRKIDHAFQQVLEKKIPH
jgi:hypothetical protein